MPDPKMPALTIYKTAQENKTIAFDFSKTGPVKAGETLSNPVLHLTNAAGVTPAGIHVLTSDFTDAEDGSITPAGEGVGVQLQGGNPGIYDISCSCSSFPSNDTPEIVGRLIITARIG